MILNRVYRKEGGNDIGSENNRMELLLAAVIRKAVGRIWMTKCSRPKKKDGIYGREGMLNRERSLYVIYLYEHIYCSYVCLYIWFCLIENRLFIRFQKQKVNK